MNFSFQSRACSTSTGDSESAKTVKCWFVNLATPWHRVVRTPFRKVPKPLLGCKVRGFWWHSKSVSIGIAAVASQWPWPLLSYCGNDENKQFCRPTAWNLHTSPSSCWCPGCKGGWGWKWQAAKTRLEGQQKLADFSRWCDVDFSWTSSRAKKTTKHVWLSSFTWLKQQFLGFT